MTLRTGMATVLRKCIPVHFIIPVRSSFSSSTKRRCFTTRQGTLLPALAAMERAGKLQCIIDSNIYDKARRGGCRHVINLHGSIYQNQCPRCKKKYPIGYMAGAKRVPICRDCNVPIRPMISLIGEMVDSQNMTKTTEEITKADTLLLLGTTLASEVFCQYIQYFAGRSMVIIHKQEHYLDKDANLVILDHPMNVLPQLGYGEEKTEE